MESYTLMAELGAKQQTRTTTAKRVCIATLAVGGVVMAFALGMCASIYSMVPSDARCLNDATGLPTTEVHAEFVNNTVVARITGTAQPLSSYHSASIASVACNIYTAQDRQLVGTTNLAPASANTAATTPGQPSRLDLTLTVTGVDGHTLALQGTYDMVCTFTGELQLFGTLATRGSATRSFALDTRSHAGGAGIASASSSNRSQDSLLSLVQLSGLPNSTNPAQTGPLTINASACFAELAKRANASALLRAGSISIPAFAYGTHLERTAVADSAAAWNLTFGGVQIDVVASTATGGIFTLSAQQENTQMAQMAKQHQQHDSSSNISSSSHKSRRDLGWVQDFNEGRASCLADKPVSNTATLTGDNSNTVHWLLPAYDTVQALYTTDTATLVLTPTASSPTLLPYKLATSHTFTVNVAADSKAYHVCFFGSLDEGMVATEFCLSAKEDKYVRGSMLASIENKTVVSGKMDLDMVSGTDLSISLSMRDAQDGTEQMSIIIDAVEKASAGAFTHSMSVRVDELLGDAGDLVMYAGGVCRAELASYAQEQDCTTSLSVTLDGSMLATVDATGYGWTATPALGNYFINSLAATIEDAGTMLIKATAFWVDGADDYGMGAEVTVTDFDDKATKVTMGLTEAPSADGFEHTVDLALASDTLNIQVASTGNCARKFFQDGQICTTAVTAVDTSDKDAPFASVTAQKYGWSLNNPDLRTLFVTLADINITGVGAMSGSGQLQHQSTSTVASLAGNVSITDFAGDEFAASTRVSETSASGSYGHRMDLALVTRGSKSSSTTLGVAGSCAHPLLTLTGPHRDCTTHVNFDDDKSSSKLKLARYGYDIADDTGSIFFELSGTTVSVDREDPATTAVAVAAPAPGINITAALQWGGEPEDFSLAGGIEASLGDLSVAVHGAFDEAATTAGIYSHGYSLNVTSEDLIGGDGIQIAADGSCIGHEHLTLDLDLDKNCSTAVQLLVDGSKVFTLDLSRYGWQFAQATSALYMDKFSLVVTDVATADMHFAYDYSGVTQHSGDLDFTAAVDILEDGVSAHEVDVATTASWTDSTNFVLDADLVASGVFGLEMDVQMRETLVQGEYDHSMVYTLNSTDIGLDVRVTANGTCADEFFETKQVCSSTALVNIDSKHLARIEIAQYGWSLGDVSAKGGATTTSNSAFVTDMAVDIESEHVPELGMTMAVDWSATPFTAAVERTMNLDMDSRMGTEELTVHIDGTTVLAEQHVSLVGIFNASSPGGTPTVVQANNLFVGPQSYNVALSGSDESGHDAFMSSSSWDMAVADPNHSALRQFLQDFDWMADSCKHGETFSFVHKSEVHYSYSEGTYATLTIRLNNLDLANMLDTEIKQLKQQLSALVVANSGSTLQLSNIKDVLLAMEDSSLRRRRDSTVTVTIILVDVDSTTAAAVANMINVAIQAGKFNTTVTVNGVSHTLTITDQVKADVITITKAPFQASEERSMSPEIIAAIAASAALVLVGAVLAVALVARSKHTAHKEHRNVDTYDEPPSAKSSPGSVRKFRVSPAPTFDENDHMDTTEVPPVYGLAVHDPTKPAQNQFAARPSQRIMKSAKGNTAASLASFGGSISSNDEGAQLEDADILADILALPSATN